MIILHEEGEDGNSMPDLQTPVQAVSKAVANLVRWELANISSCFVLFLPLHQRITYPGLGETRSTLPKT